MQIYETGLFISFSLVALDRFFLLLRFLGQKDIQNYAKINFFFSFLSNEFSQKKKKPDLIIQIIYFAVNLAISSAFALLSWFYIIFRLCSAGIELYHKIMIPNHVKDALWAIRTRNLSEKEVAENHLIINGNNSPENVQLYLDQLNEFRQS